MKKILFLLIATLVTASQIEIVKPHDHTNKALDIMVKKDVLKLNYGALLYTKYCSSCHGKSFDKKSSLKKYNSISKLYLKIKKGCKKGKSFKSLSRVKLIFIAREIKFNQ